MGLRAGYPLNRSPGLVVKGGDSDSEGCDFKSRHWILDGHFFTLICCKICIVCLKRPKINGKEVRMAHFNKGNGVDECRAYCEILVFSNLKNKLLQLTSLASCISLFY